MNFDQENSCHSIFTQGIYHRDKTYGDCGYGLEPNQPGRVPSIGWSVLYLLGKDVAYIYGAVFSEYVFVGKDDLVEWRAINQDSSFL